MSDSRLDARYATATGATVTVKEEQIRSLGGRLQRTVHSWTCTGCRTEKHGKATVDRGTVRRQAEEHAETCQAIPTV